MRVAVGKLGAKGERRARWYYRLRGYSIVATNVRIAGGEIDLIVQRGGTLAFVEVKTRQSLRAGEGFEAVDQRKRAQLVKLAEAFVARMRKPPRQIRYDVLSLYWTGLRFRVRAYVDAFRPVGEGGRPWRWRV